MSIHLGNPRFKRPELAELAARAGVPAAWKEAFATGGVRAPGEAANDFAVAIATPGGGTFAAVDRFAVQTLCYRVQDGRLRVAGRADELADPGHALDPQAIFDYLYFHVIPSPRTVFKDIFRLPPGHYALFENGALTVAPYWTPSFTEGNGRSFADLRGEFRQIVRDAVAARMDREDLGCFLSGGTDSSTVAGMITELGGRPAESYSIGFDVAGYDEMEYARIAARHFGTKHHEYYVTPADLVQGMPAVAASYDQPFGNSSAVPAYFCALRARQDGIGKLLAGDGGDELFGGNKRYAMQRVFGWYGSAPELFRRRVAEPLTDSGLLDRIPLARKGAGYVRQARLPMPDRMQTYNLLSRMGIETVLSGDFLAQVDTDDPIRQQREVYRTCPESASLVNQMLAFDWRYTLAENDLPKVVGSARLAGVEVGFPLLDDRLLDFSAELPTAYKLKGLKLRWFFKEALRGFLPDAILAKKKHGFGLPFGAWAIGHAPLNAMTRDLVHGLADRGIVRRDFVDPLIAERLPEHPGYYGEMVWIMAMLELWLRQRA